MKKIFLFASAAALLLGACSQDLTEDLEVAAPSVAGEDTIVATLASDSETRTHLGSNGTYAWDDNADALGVFAATPGNAVNAYFGYAGKNDDNKTIFKGNLSSIKGGDFMAYYPWSAGTKISDAGTLTFEIPATQYYNHNATEGYGSFAPGVVPMVAKNEETIATTDKGDTLQLTFDALASYIAVPFRGEGVIETVTLEKVTVNGNSGPKITGSVTVDLFKADSLKIVNYKNETTTDEESGTSKTERVPVYDDTFFTVTPNITGDKITLDCGDGVRLDPNTKKYFVFVVPPYIPFEVGHTLRFVVNGTATYEYKFKSINTTGRNKLMPLTSEDYVYDGSGRYRIEKPEQFVEYAYAATNGQIAGHEMNSGAGLKNAVIVKPLNFKDYTYEGTYADVAKWYNETNEGAISTIGGNLVFSIEGEVAEGATISNLKVAGKTGMFVSATDRKDSVKNITFEDLEVEGDYVLTQTLYENSTKYEGVVFENVPEGKAIVGRVFDGVLKSIGESITYPEGTIFANTLVAFDYKSIGFASVEPAAAAEGAEEAEEDNIYKPEYIVPAKFTNFKNLEVHNQKPGVIFYVDYDSSSNSKYARELMSKVTINENGWYSVLDNKEHYSYWTGTTAPSSNNGDDIYTAEELVYDLKNATGEATITLNTDIDFGINKAKLKDVEVKAEKLTVDGGGKTILRANIYGTGLFGTYATVTNLTVKSSFVYGTAVLAKTGTAPKGVTLSNINYQHATEEVVGGMFYEGTIANATVTKGKVTPTYIEGKKFGAHYARLTIDLPHEDNTPLPKDAPYAVLILNGTDALGENAQNSNIYFEAGMTLEELNAIADNIEWSGKIPTGYKVELISGNVATDKATYDGRVYNEDMLADAIENAEENAEIKVAAGTYENAENIFTDALAKGVTIECEEGTVFEFDSKINFNQTTVKNATFRNTADILPNNKQTMTFGKSQGSVFENCTFEGEKYALNYPNTKDLGDVTFTGCTFTTTSSEKNAFAIHFDNPGVCTITLNECTINGWAAFPADATLVMTDCKFTDEQPNNYLELWGNSTLTGCKFTYGAEQANTGIKLGSTTKKYEFDGCTVNDRALVSSDITGYYDQAVTIK